MDEEALNTSVRKFLKNVGVTSQREIESAVAAALQGHRVSGSETFEMAMTLDVPGLDLHLKITGELKLQ